MIRLLIIGLILVLPGCAVTLYGNETSGGGSTVTTTGSAIRGGTQIGNAIIGGSFGTPPASGAPGGQVTFTNGASGVLLGGLLIVGAVDLIGEWFKPAAPRPVPRTGNVSQTCSCYGWQPELTPAPPSQ